MEFNIESSWKTFLKDTIETDYFTKLTTFIKSEYENHTIYPPADEIFKAFEFCSPSKTRVVILGQDPYHGPQQAHGLCFSVNDGIKTPPSLVNIFKEIKSDLGKEIPQSGNLERWAKQGVLLLNATLTVRANTAGSHQKQGWEQFTDSVIKHLAEEGEHIVFLLWGAYAIKKSALIESGKHCILTSAHPSPLSAYRGFLGNKHFSTTNAYLKSKGLPEIDW